MATNKRSTGKRRSAFRRAVLASSSALALSASLFAAAPAQASTQDLYTFVPIRLTVHDIEDSWPDWRDEPRMYYGGAVWVDVVARGGYPGVIPNVDFTGPHMFVDLWERDGGWCSATLRMMTMASLMVMSVVVWKSPDGLAGGALGGHAGAVMVILS